MSIAEPHIEQRTRLRDRISAITGQVRKHKTGAPDPDLIEVFARRFGSWQISVGRQVIDASELARHYDAAAPGWDRLLDRLGAGFGYEMLLRQFFAAHSGRQEAARVLDCGIGTGALSQALGRVAPMPFELHGVDIAPGMLRQAERNLGGSGISGRLLCADARALPFADNSFDMVMSAHMLEHFADPGQALAEMVRVVRPGGTILICATSRSAFGALVQLRWHTHRLCADELRGWLSGTGLVGIRELGFGRRGLGRWTSVACAGRKA